MDEAELHVVALELAEALGDRLERALDVGLQDQVQRGRLAPLDLLEDVLELGAALRRGGRGHVAGHPEALLAGLADGAGLGQVGGDPELVAGLGRLGETEHLDRRRRQRLLDLVAVVVDEGLDLAPRRAGHDRVADPQRAALDDDRGHRAPADVEVGLEDGAAGPALGAGLAAPRPRPPATSCSSRSSMPRFCRAETSTMMVSPPQASGTSPCSESCCMTRLGSASSRSILLTATMIGTSAALAWLIASTVWGMTPSSAATTSTTMSVTSAPRARMAVKASWPGVSMKVIRLAVATRPGRRRCAG